MNDVLKRLGITEGEYDLTHALSNSDSDLSRMFPSHDKFQVFLSNIFFPHCLHI